LAAAQTGCVELSYNQIQLGQEERVCRRALPEDQTISTPKTICSLERGPSGRTDAIVVLLAADRRVAGKLHAVHIESRWGPQRQMSYQLRGELDPQLLGLAATGPIDVSRVLADELTNLPEDAFARTTQAWVAGGLVRLLERWPQAGPAGPAAERHADLLDRIPGGGTARITIDDRGRYLLEYIQAGGD